MGGTQNDRWPVWWHDPFAGLQPRTGVAPAAWRLGWGNARKT